MDNIDKRSVYYIFDYEYWDNIKVMVKQYANQQVEIVRADNNVFRGTLAGFKNPKGEVITISQAQRIELNGKVTEFSSTDIYLYLIRELKPFQQTVNKKTTQKQGNPTGHQSDNQTTLIGKVTNHTNNKTKQKEAEKPVKSLLDNLNEEFHKKYISLDIINELRNYYDQQAVRIIWSNNEKVKAFLSKVLKILDIGGDISCVWNAQWEEIWKEHIAWNPVCRDIKNDMATIMSSLARNPVNSNNLGTAVRNTICLINPLKKKLLSSLAKLDDSNIVQPLQNAAMESSLDTDSEMVLNFYMQLCLVNFHNHLILGIIYKKCLAKQRKI